MPKKDETYPKTRHQYASVAPKNHGSVQRGKTVKAKSGWSQNVNWKHNTCYCMSFQDDKEMAKQRLQATDGHRGIVYMLAICHPRGCATGARSKQVLLLMAWKSLCRCNGMILQFFACINLFARLCGSTVLSAQSSNLQKNGSHPAKTVSASSGTLHKK